MPLNYGLTLGMDIYDGINRHREKSKCTDSDGEPESIQISGSRTGY